ncbi:MAG: GldM family protein [Flavobacterium sp.]|nr:GldM family protein [Flavobacterium sp.]
MNKVKFLIFILISSTINCNAQKANVSDILLIETSKGKTIYEGISNEIFYNTWNKEDIKRFKFTAKENCQIIDHEGYLTITPTSSSKFVIINVELNNSISQDFIFFVQKLPLPQLLFNLDDEVEKQILPYKIATTDIKNLKLLEAKIEIGRSSWLSYEILDYEILINKSKGEVIRLKNIGQIMSDENLKKLEKLESGDLLSFININCYMDNNKISFNERTISIK